MKYKLDQKEIRVYKKENSSIFKKNNEEFGGLSNMATGFPLKINGVEIRTTEALYQACRFPHLPEIQQKIIEQKSPMLVKMISNTNKKRSRNDWDNIRLKVMKWCINIKLAQNFVSFGATLHETGLRNIVENSAKDNFWGAIPNEDATVFTGKNALGRLLMDLRQAFYSKENFSLLFVEPQQIENFLLFNEPIGTIDERPNFVNWLQSYWGGSYKNGVVISSHSDIDYNKKEEATSYVTKESKMNVEEENQPYTKTKATKPKRQSKKKKEDAILQANLFTDTDSTSS